MIRIVLAEDHAVVRAGLRLLIDAEPDMHVVAELADGRHVIESINEAGADVAVLDLSMPGVSGLGVTRLLHRERPEVKVVALTRHRDAAFVDELLLAGAMAYVLKQSPSTELLRAIRAAANGERYLDPSLPNEQSDARRRDGTPRATDRELRVLRMLAFGYSNKEIAAELNISVKTVEVHKANVMRKLNLRGRADAVTYALLNGWLDAG